jgi:predicted permease
MGIVDDVRYAVRSLVRNPTVTLFAVLTTGLGVGATTAMFGTVEAVVLHPLPYEAGDRMVSLFTTIHTEQTNAFVSIPGQEYLDAWRAQSDVFEALEPWAGRSMTLTGRGDAVELEAALIRPAYHELIGREPAFGRTFDAEEVAADDARVVMLSHEFATRTFGGAADALGASLTLDGAPWTVIGVMPRHTLLPGWGITRVELWRPLPASAEGFNALGVLRDGVTAAEATERLEAMSAEGRLERAGYASLVSDQVSRGLTGYLGLLMGAVVLLLLIACVNVSNLLLFRADARKRETAVRAALGGGRARLTRQFLIESILLALLGGMVGLAVATAGHGLILRLRPQQLDVLDRVTLNGPVLGFAFTVTLLTGVLFGLLPALRAGRPDGLTSLRSGVRTEGDVVGRRLRWLLVSGEVALSFALLIGSLTVLSTLVERQRVDFGYAVDEVTVVRTDAPTWRYETGDARREVFDRVRGSLARLPGVAEASLASGAPPRTGVRLAWVQVEGDDSGAKGRILHGPDVDARYFSALGQSVIAGRTFSDAELAGEEGAVILGASTARTLFPDGDAVGGRIGYGQGDVDWLRVVGVVADVPMTGLNARDEVLQLYGPLREPGSVGVFVLRLAPDGSATAAASMIREAIADIDADIRVDQIADGRSLQRDTLENERFVTTIMAAFATFALVLAAIGLYGVVSQVVGRRTREIGIRVALGARRSTIASMVLRRAGGATAAGVAVGVVLALAGGRVLASRVEGIETAPWTTFVLGAAALALTALLAAYAPARRAAAVDPVEAIRAE